MLLRCWFYNPALDGMWDGGPWGGSLWNKTVAYLDGPWCHVELQFTDGAALSVYSGGTVRLRQREFDVSRYSCVSIACTTRQAMLARTSAEDHVDSAQRFGLAQAVAALAGVRYSGRPSHTFCSKLVAEVLHDAGVLSDDAPRALTPTALYNLLQAPASACDPSVSMPSLSTLTHTESVQRPASADPIGFAC